MIWRCVSDGSANCEGRDAYALEEADANHAFEGEDLQGGFMGFAMRFESHTQVELQDCEDADGKGQVLDDDDVDVRKGRRE
jgi:hypothetical protein